MHTNEPHQAAQSTEARLLRKPVIILVVSALACAAAIAALLAFDKNGAGMMRTIGVSAVFYIVLLLGLFLGLRIRSAANRALHTQELLVVICIGIVAATMLPSYLGNAFELIAWVLFNWTALVGFYVLYAWKLTHDAKAALKKSQEMTAADYSITRLSPNFWPAQAEGSARKWGYEPVSEAAKRLNNAAGHGMTGQNSTDQGANATAHKGLIEYGFLARSNGAIASVNSKRVFFESTKGTVIRARRNGTSATGANDSAPAAPARVGIGDILFFDNAILLSDALVPFESDETRQAEKTATKTAQEKAQSVRIFGLRCDPDATWLVPYADIARAEKDGRAIVLTLKNNDAISIDAKAVRSGSAAALKKSDAATALVKFLEANADIADSDQQSTHE